MALRAVKVREEGQTHLDILRKISTPPLLTMCENHTLALLGEFHFQDIVIAMFPLVGASVRETLDRDFRKSSIGDLLDILMQALEVRNFFFQNHSDRCNTSIF
jgi:hypothetical protein